MLDPFNLEQTTSSTCFKRRNEDSEGSRSHGSRMRSKADLCDSNFVHVGTTKEQKLRLSASSTEINSHRQPLGPCQLTSHVTRE